jgi:2-polyprenyl-6-methoxyphenol hydroxylase-like FAD-dependent oxidoreductase
MNLKIPRLGKHSIVIGAGIAGLASAKALANYFDKVTIIERDLLSSQVAWRHGVPQGRQPHILLKGGLVALECLFPAIDDDFRQAGAVPLDPGFELRLEIVGQQDAIRVKLGWDTYALSRPVLEHTIRSRVKRVENIEVLGGLRAQEIVHKPGCRAVAGIKCRTVGGAVTTIDADLIVDASGAGTLTNEFLKAIACNLPEKTSIRNTVRYSSAFFKGVNLGGGYKAIATYPKMPEQPRGALATQVENDMTHVLLINRAGENLPTDGNEFSQYTTALSTLSIYNAIKTAQRVSEAVPFSFNESRWYHYAQMQDFPTGLIPIGDALCRFNPIYGQGMSVAAREARLLMDLFATAENHSLPTLGATFLAKADEIISDPWTMSTLPDLASPDTIGERPADLKERLRSQAALVRLAARDVELLKLLVEVRHLLKPLSTFDEPFVKKQVEEEMAQSALNN